jgi:tRNA A-37 threonylcarbamoyl transferase component Bud32
MNDRHVTESVAPDTSSAPGSVYPPLAAGTTLADRYEIRRLLGSGGYSHVYAAWDSTLRREIAIKVLRRDRVSESSLKRLRREVLVAQKTRNPNLLRIYDFAQDGEHVFLTMELVSGTSLREKIAAGALPPDEAIRIAKDVLEALHELHLSGVVHRDVKPGNILIDEEGAVRLADFGLARELDSDETRATATDSILGTFRYVSPEQALGGDVDGRCDLFSLGIVMFEMLTQQSPFESSSSLGMLLAHVNRRAPDVRTLRPDVPRWLAAVIARLLEQKREFRYPNALSVIQDLERHRARIAPARLRRMFASALLLVTLVAIALVSMTPDPRLDRISIEVGRPARAFDENGATLWTRDDLTRPDVATIVNLREGRYVAAFLNSPIYVPFIGVERELSLLDAETGEVVETVVLPEPPSNFDDLPMNFGSGGIKAMDLDGDGFDEIIVSLLHYPYYPSFTLVYYPTSGLSQYVFAARGHHRAQGAVDLDGDGVKEIIMAGINNRLGWHIAVAAVKVPPPSKLPGDLDVFHIPSSPDSAYFAPESVNDDRIVFYALLPEGSYHDVSIDETARLIRVKLDEGDPYSVTFDGFLDTDRSDLEPAERNELRRQAYRSLRRSDVDAGLGNPEDGLLTARSAIELADRAGDSILGTWSRRVAARRQVESGDIEGAVAQWHELVKTPELVHPVSWDAGRALHVAGFLDEAVDWYSRGISDSTALWEGRSLYQYMEGVLLALAEADRGAEMRERTEAWRKTFGTGQFLGHFEAFAQWIDNRPVEWDLEKNAPQGPDLERMWEYEFRRAAGVDPGELLSQFDGDPLPVQTAPALMASFRAELLADLGRTDDAVAEARSAWDAVLSAPRDDLVTRAHRRIIGERYVRLARTKDLRDEAARVSTALSR